MNVKLILAILLLFAMKISVAQSKRNILNNKIKSVTEIVTLYENGNKIIYTGSYTLYNKKGRIVEEISYGRDGGIQKKQTYTYDNDKNKTEETLFSKKEKGTAPKNDIENTRTTFRYNANNDKIEEKEYDSMGNMGKRIKCIYNAKGLKTKRETYLSGDRAESVKIYTYEFY